MTPTYIGCTSEDSKRVNREGGTNIRVILDSELKKILYRDLARAGQNGRFRRRQDRNR